MSLPRNPHPEDIKAAVRKTRYGSLAALSRAFGLPRHACSHALARPHLGGEQAIAAALGKKPQDLWPSRFDRAGNRICRPPRHTPKSTPVAPAGHCENRSAA